MIQVSFIGTAKEENEVKEMQNCVTEIINTIQYIKWSKKHLRIGALNYALAAISRLFICWSS